MDGPGGAPIRAKGHRNARLAEPRQVTGLNAERLLGCWPIPLRLLHPLQVVGGDRPAQPTQISRHSGIREVRNQDNVGALAPEGDELIIDVPVAYAVRERVDPGAEKPLRVLQVEYVGCDAETFRVGLVDDRAVQCR